MRDGVGLGLGSDQTPSKYSFFPLMGLLDITPTTINKNKSACEHDVSSGGILLGEMTTENIDLKIFYCIQENNRLYLCTLYKDVECLKLQGKYH